LYENFKLQFADMRSKARAGVKLSADQKKKISEKMIGHEVSKETRKKISDKAKTRIRKPFSEEYKKRHSEIMKARHRWNTPL
jgi:F0F1-type ATP synthase membrane subunit b/b'